MVKRIGYLNGVDPMVLTRLSAEGIGTLPLSNGWDDHGKYIAHVTPADGFSAIVAPLHKVMAAPGDPVGPKDVLTSVMDSGIPLFIVAPKEIHKKARGIINEENIQFVDPKDLFQELRKALKL